MPLPFNAASLQKVTLTAVEQNVEHKISLARAVQLETKQNARLRAVDVESWYDNIPEHTFPTVFIPLTPDDATAIRRQYYCKQQESTTVTAAGIAAKSALAAMSAETMTSTLATLQGKVQAAIVKLGWEANGVFAKLSSRSPKDSVYCLQRAVAIVKNKLIRQHTISPDSVDDNAIVIAIMGASIECLKLNTAEEVLNCFTTSDRVCCDDIPLALSFASKTWSQHLVIRKWVSIPTQNEFRGFVYNGQLTAVSQYYNDAYFPELEAKKAQIEALLRACFEDMKDRVGVEPREYSIDFAVDLEHQKAYIIELNPFGKPDGLGTGTVLFDNKKQADLDVLFGVKPFEFRTDSSKQVTKPTLTGDLKLWIDAECYKTDELLV
jgi:hypothetical protein